MATGEFTKGWQYRAAPFKDKAWQPQAVTRRALQMHHGVGVPGQHGVCGMLLRMVAAGERADDVGLINHADAQISRWVARPAVVVASHQRAVKLRMALPPEL